MCVVLLVGVVSTDAELILLSVLWAIIMIVIVSLTTSCTVYTRRVLWLVLFVQEKERRSREGLR